MKHQFSKKFNRAFNFGSVLTVIVFFLAGCSSTNEETKENESSTMEKPIADSLLFEPYFCLVFVEGPAFYKPSFNTDYVKRRHIKSIKFKMFESKNGDWKDFEEEKIFSFDTDGKITDYVDYYTADGAIDTSFYTAFYYEENLISYKATYFMGRYAYLHEYFYDGKYLTEAESAEGTDGMTTVFEYDSENILDRNLVSIKEYIRDTLRSIDLFVEGEITDEKASKIAKEWAEQLNSPAFLMLYVIQTDKGIPVYKIRIDENGKKREEDDYAWSYNKEGKLISYSCKTVLDGRTLYDKFEYGKDGLIKTVYWKDDYRMDVTYEFY